MASASSSLSLGPEQPCSEKPFISSAMGDLLQNVATLHFRLPGGREITEADFKDKNASATVREVLHFLYSTYDSEQVHERMNNIWPVTDGECDKRFRHQITRWIQELQDDSDAAAYVQDFTPALLLRPKTQQCTDFLLMLSLFVLQHKLRDCKLDFGWDGPGIQMPPLAFVEYTVEKITAQNGFLENSLAEADAEYTEAVRLLQVQNEKLDVKCKQLTTEVQNECAQTDDHLKELFHKVQTDWQQVTQVMELVEKITERIRSEDHVVDCAAHVDERAQVTTETGDVDLVRFFNKCGEFKKDLLTKFDDEEWNALCQVTKWFTEKASSGQEMLDRLRACGATVDAHTKELEELLAASLASLKADVLDHLPHEAGDADEDQQHSDGSDDSSDESSDTFRESSREHSELSTNEQAYVDKVVKFLISTYGHHKGEN